MALDRKNLAAGLIFAAFGLGLIVIASRTLKIGTAGEMGPGFYPVIIGIVLIVLGALIAIAAPEADQGERTPVPWRGIALISAAIILAGAVMGRIGFVPTIAVATFIACFASRRMTIAYAGLLTVALTALCFVVFKLGLALSVPAFGS